MELAKCLLLIAIIDESYAYVTSRVNDNPKEIKSTEPTKVKDIGTMPGNSRYCNYGQYAIGFQLKVEKHIGWTVLSDDDDTGANSFRLLCAPFQKTAPLETIDAENIGPNGIWGKEIKCSDGYHMTAFKTKTEAYRGVGRAVGLDDTGVNSIIIKCSDGSQKDADNGGEYGDWGVWGMCKGDNRYICGFRQRVEKYSWGDTFGMTVLRMDCCDATLNFNEKIGLWKLLNVKGGKVLKTESKIISSSLTSSNSYSYTQSLSAAIKAGYEFSNGITSDITVTGTVAETAARDISKTHSTSTWDATAHTCPTKKYFYQFIMQAQEAMGAAHLGNMEWKTPYFVCTDIAHPRCPGGACIDADCQICFTTNGYREIKSFLWGDYCIRVFGKTIDLYKCNNGRSQKWHLIHVSQGQDSKFIIKSKAGKCLTVNKKIYDDQDNGGKFELIHCNPQDKMEQVWYYEDKQIKSTNGKCLDIVGTAKNYATVQLHDCLDSRKGQKWKLVAFQNSSGGNEFGINAVYVIGCVVLMSFIFFVCGTAAGILCGFVVLDDNSPFKIVM